MPLKLGITKGTYFGSYLYSKESILLSQHIQQIPFLTLSHLDPSSKRPSSHTPTEEGISHGQLEEEIIDQKTKERMMFHRKITGVPCIVPLPFENLSLIDTIM